jgi:hypothetical protein
MSFWMIGYLKDLSKVELEAINNYWDLSQKSQSVKEIVALWLKNVRLSESAKKLPSADNSILN